MFINFADNKSLDSQGFAPFGEVVSGMDHVNLIYGGYGDGDTGPSQAKVKELGDEYLKKFPKLTKIDFAVREPRM